MLSNSPRELLSPTERRRERRRRSFLAGRIIFDDGKRIFDCAIRDLTDRGAKITIPENQTFPSCFHLISMRERVVHECTVVWLKDGEAGLAFLKTVRLGGLTGTKLDYLRTLWLERAAS